MGYYNVHIPHIDGSDFLKFSTTDLTTFLEYLKMILPLDLEDVVQINIDVSATASYPVPDDLNVFLATEWPRP